MAGLGGAADGPTRVLSAAGSHLYPGARGTMRDPGGGEACMVEFADGSVAFGRLAATQAGLVLELDGYTTGRGTAIPARRWGVELIGGESAEQFRITARLP